jgi:hypothetical protein
VANIVDDWPFIKQNPGASAREKKERCSIKRYTSALSKSMLFSYRRDAVPYQRDSKKSKVSHRTIGLEQAAARTRNRRSFRLSCFYVIRRMGVAERWG